MNSITTKVQNRKITSHSMEEGNWKGSESSQLAWGIRLVLILLVVLGISACVELTPVVSSPAPFLPLGTSTVTLSQILPSDTDTITPVPTAGPTSVPTPTIVALNFNPRVVVLAENLPEPDDLILAPDGSIMISDVSDGTIKQLTRDGQLHGILSGLSEPEGMVFLPDGSLIIAEQGKNRLIRYDFTSNTLTPFLNLENKTNNLGVDGIAWNGSSLIVPDSPNGNVLAVSPDGKTIQKIASGLTRPTGVWPESNGDLLIADEYGNSVMRLHADGTLEKIATFSIPDDVIEDASGNIFVVTLGDDALHVITAGTNQDVVLLSGLNNPQGIIFDMDGNLIATDSGNHRLIKVVIH